MIVEGIVTTLNPLGALNIAPMGPSLGADLSMRHFVLRPYRSSTTYQNLKSTGAGVFHVTDDVLLLAQSAIGAPLVPFPETREAETIPGRILTNACRYYEFRVVSLDDREDRARIQVQTQSEGRGRDFLGFNRARHAVLEAAILATRTAFLPREEILAEFDRLETIVTRTGGIIEEQAFRLLREHVVHSDPEASPT